MFAIGRLLYLGVIVFCAGDALNALLFRKAFRQHAALRFALSYGLGTGSLSLLLLYLSCAGVGLTAANMALLSLPVIPLWVYACLVRYPAARVRTPGTALRGGLFSRCLSALCILCIVAALAIVFFRALFLPMHLADDMVQWCIRAKIIFHTGTVLADDFFEPCRVLYHATYPPLVPLLESLVFTALGEADDVLVKILFPVFFAALLALFYAAQRRFAPPRHALLFTAMLAVVPVFIGDGRGNPASGYADVPLSFFYFAAVVFLLQWLATRARNELLLAALAMSFAVFTKKEGTVLWLMLTGFTALLTIIKDRRVSRDVLLLIAIFGIMPAVLNLPWTYIKTYLLPISAWEQDFVLSNLTIGFLADKLHRLPALFSSVLRAMFFLESYNVLWILFFVSIALAWRRALSLPAVLLPLLVLCNVGSVFAASFLYPHFWWGNFPGDMPRLLMFNTPLVLYFISLQACPGAVVNLASGGQGAA